MVFESTYVSFIDVMSLCNKMIGMLRSFFKTGLAALQDSWFASQMVSEQIRRKMGRKGVSKRKSKQPASKPFSAGSETSVGKAAESQPVKTNDSTQGASSMGRKKASKKG
jgi:hypothetical protein